MSLVSETRSPAIGAWAALLRGHAATVRTLNAQLVADHALTINDYEVLLLLAHAEDERLRRTDLAQNLHLTASGVTRLLEGLQQADYVRNAHCSVDGRVTYAVLTEAGRAKLEDASCSHLAAVRELFEERYSSEELESLAALLERLPGGASPSCAPPRRPT